MSAQGVGKFQSRQFVGEHILHIVGIGAANVLGRDHPRLHRALGYAARRSRTRNNSRTQCRIRTETLRRQPLRIGQLWGAEAAKQKQEQQPSKCSHFRTRTKRMKEKN